jgi:DNA-binding transcriptional MerR regulator
MYCDHLSIEGGTHMKQVDLLEPVRVADHLDGVVFSVWQVCRLVEITKMQLNYWTERTAIKTFGGKQRHYDADSVELLMLIKQGRDLGFGVPTAIEAAREFRQRSRLERRSDTAADPQAA